MLASETCDHADESCLVLRVLPSGDYRLLCRHSGLLVGHLPRNVYLSRVSHTPGGPSSAQLRADFTVPLECSSADRFDLVGGFLDASGCTCPQPVDMPHLDGEDTV